MRERVLITGIGCVSSLGGGLRTFADAVRQGASGVRPVTAFDTSSCRSHRAAMLRGFDPAAFLPPMKLRRIDEVGRLAIATAKLALDDARWGASADDRADAGVSLGTYTAGLDSTVAYLRGFLRDGAAGVPALLFSNTVSNAPASLIAIEFGLHGPNVTFNQREASGLAALAFAITAIRNGRATAMLSGAADRIEEVLFKVYDRFHALSPRQATGDEAARPYDRRRNGFVLGEAGVLLLLESGRSAAARSAAPYGELLGVGASASPAKVNAWPADPAGLVRAMLAALTDAGLRAADVDAVFGTADGSPHLDALEAAAIDEVFGGRRVAVTSLKGAIGESGAAGVASIAAGLLLLPSGVVPPTAGWAEADPACPVDVAAWARPTAGDTFMVNSVASGGTNCSVVVRAFRR